MLTDLKSEADTSGCRHRLGEVLVCGLDCSRVDFLQLWEGGGEELEADAEGETDWTWRQQEEETGRQRQLDNERTRLWVCDRQEEYVLPHPPTTYNVPTTQPRVVEPHARQHSLSSSPAGTLKPSSSTSTYSSTSPTSSSSSSLPIRNNHVKIEAALAKFDLLSDIVAIHR